MPSERPVGSTTDLPPNDQIEAAEESREADIDALFGMSDTDDEVAAASEDATSSDGAAGAAGAVPVDGQVAAPALPSGSEAPPSPSGDAASAQTVTPPDGTSSAPAGQQPAQAGQTPPPAAAPGVVAPVDAEKLRMASLEATVAALQAELVAARASPPAAQPQSGQAGVSPQPSEQADLPRYALTLPPPIAAALTSGDDQQTVAGITHMMNSLATIVHHNVRQEMRQSFGQLLSSARAQDAASHDQSFIENSRNDYYNAFPDHNNPLILPLIQAESVAMAGEFPGLPWNEDYRNALGQRVNNRLAQLRGQAQPGQGAVPPAPAAMLPVGARPGEAPGGELTGGDLIADTFS